MLVLTRKHGQSVLVGDAIEVVVLEIRGSRVKLGIRGPAEVPIHRKELALRINGEGHDDVPVASAMAAAGCR